MQPVNYNHTSCPKCGAAAGNTKTCSSCGAVSSPSGLPLLSPCFLSATYPVTHLPLCPLSPLASSSHLIPVPYPLQGPTPDTWPKDKIAKQEVTVSNLSRLLCLHRPAPTKPWSLHPANAMPQGDP
ncbi:hypothetical protein ACCO45_003813 [Purpureocillium lilacinum]|uniref:Uncharacterized protein n=1 Tax=Purpureocillium lilacinum TaxID=33203 RepID=A0ACC4E0Y2_PURLI